jgi:hypothetical protein
MRHNCLGDGLSAACSQASGYLSQVRPFTGQGRLLELIAYKCSVAQGSAVPRNVAGQTQLVLVLITAVTRAVSPVLQPVLGARPSRALLTDLCCLPAFLDLLAPSPQMLQRQLDQLHQFCVAGMEVNVAKTEVVVLSCYASSVPGRGWGMEMAV